MPATSPSGTVGNLTTEQEAKLRQLWGTIFKLLDMYSSDDPEIKNALKNYSAQAASPPPQKSRFGLFGGAKKPSAEESKAAATIEKQLGFAATDENDKYGLQKKFMDMLGKHTAESVRKLVIEAVKMDHPDALALRFLRARKWEVDKGFVMMLSALEWRDTTKVDSDIMARGEAGAVADENSTDPNAKALGSGFMRQLRVGKSFLHGTDKEGRPVNYARVRLHKPSESSNESLERFIINFIETGRCCLTPPVETACLVFDLTGFTLANMDYPPVKFIIQAFEANYPESLGAILVHNAPWVFKGIWKIIHGWLDPVVASKVHFTNGRDGPDGLTNFIAPDQLIRELGGDEEWEYKYDEPVEGENDLMKDTKTRDRLMAERRELANKFEEVTRRWVESGAADDMAERNRLAKQLGTSYWKLDPYIRARGLYDRQGNMRGGRPPVWTAEEKAAAEEEDDEANSKDTFVDAGDDADVAATTKAVGNLKMDDKNPVAMTANAVAA